MVRSNELIKPVIGLTTRDIFLSIKCVRRQLIGPVHPIDAGIDVVLIASTYLKDSCNPVIVRFCPRYHLFPIGSRFLALDGALIRNEDVVVAKVFGTVH